MAQRRDLLGKPEEENTASSSTQSASGLGGGTPEGGPSQPHERARRTSEAERAEREDLADREEREDRERREEREGID